MSHPISCCVTNQSTTCSSVYGWRATASSHISCDLKWSGIIFNDHGSIPTVISHISCVKRRSGTSSNRHGSFSMAYSHISCVLVWLGTRRSSTEGKRSNIPFKTVVMPGSMRTAVSHISWVLRLWGTCVSPHGLWATAVSHISWVLRLSGTCPTMHGLRATASSYGSWTLKYISIYGYPAWCTKIHF